MLPQHFSHLAPPGPYRAITDGSALAERVFTVPCPVCMADAGFACEVDEAARPYPSVMRIGGASPFHVARAKTGNERHDG